MCIDATIMCKASTKDTKLMHEIVKYYDVIREIMLLNYYCFQQTLFKYDGMNILDKKIGCKNDEMGYIMINMSILQHGDKREDDPFILVSKAK